MELNRIYAFFRVFKGGIGAICAFRNGSEPFGKNRDKVGMTHQSDLIGQKTIEKI